MMLISWWCTFPNAFFKSFEVTVKDFCFVLVWLIACIRLSRCSKVPDIPIMKLFCVPLLMEPFLIKNEYQQLQMHEVITFSIISFSAIGLKSLFINNKSNDNNISNSSNHNNNNDNNNNENKNKIKNIMIIIIIIITILIIIM